MLRIIHKQKECIGCDVCCDVAPNYWFMNEVGLAELHSILRTKGTLHFGEGWVEDMEILNQAAEECPVNIIRIERIACKSDRMGENII
ncbi:MAG: ferredoxin [Opitutaceae bacterium]|nr:ferredoxin [Opitutaceae bacterium]|tara:strand:+ start:27 stop:290 length:264 start_codon:yes stop_codon:yes gene_type:complete